MNELIFFIHLLVILFGLLGSFKLGKEGLFSFIILQSIFANLFISKQIEVFMLTLTCSDLYIVGAIIGLNLLQEFYGKEEAKKAIYFSFLGQIFFLTMSKIHLAYVPALCDLTQAGFSLVFKNTLRIVLASLSVFFIVQRFDILFYDLLKKRFKNLFVIRIFSSSFLSQSLDTLLFSFLGLYGIVQNIFHVMLVSFLVKMIAVFSCGFFIFFAKKLFTLEKKDV